MRIYRESDLVTRAKALAARGYAVCPDYDGLPYVVHPAFVARRGYEKVAVLEQEGFASDEIDAAMAGLWLHDILEDVPGISYNDLKTEFGELTAEVVFLVTDHKGRTRHERQHRTYQELHGEPLTDGSQARANTLATFVKLCDRYENVIASLMTSGRMFEKYRDEQPHFRELVHFSGRLESLWADLEDLFASQ